MIYLRLRSYVGFGFYSIQTRDVEFASAGRAVALAHSVFELAKAKGFSMTLLDIGESVGKKLNAELSMKEVSSSCIASVFWVFLTIIYF